MTRSFTFAQGIPYANNTNFPDRRFKINAFLLSLKEDINKGGRAGEVQTTKSGFDAKPEYMTTKVWERYLTPFC
jgi:hypothetical protein